jgi:plasmid stability protein
MPVDLSIKRVPDALAKRLRKRARRNNRSLQGELMAILEDALHGSPPPATATATTVREQRPAFAARPSVPRGVAPPSESTLMIREDRDGRTFTVRDLYEYVSSLGPGTPDESTAWIRKARSSR